MPYSVDKKSKCVFHKNPDGSRGKKVGCTKGSLKKYLSALYMHETCCKRMSLSKLLDEVKKSKNKGI